MSGSIAVVLAFAQGHAACDTAGVGPWVADDPFAAGRSTVFTDDLGFAAGVVRVGGRHEVVDYPLTEMLVVHAGELSVVSGEQVVHLKAGGSVVIARGTAFTLDAGAEALWAWCATRAHAGAKPGLTVLDRHAHLSPSAPPGDDILISQAPQCRAQGAFEEGALRIGVWDSTAYERRSRGHLCHELMHLTEGQVTLRLDQGRELVVNPGDTVFVAKGARCGWLSQGYVRKFYAVV